MKLMDQPIMIFMVLLVLLVAMVVLGDAEVGDWRRRNCHLSRRVPRPGRVVWKSKITKRMRDHPLYLPEWYWKWRKDNDIR